MLGLAEEIDGDEFGIDTVVADDERFGRPGQQIDADPTLRLGSARTPMRIPQTLSEAQVEALLAAPVIDRPLGLRDREVGEKVPGEFRILMMGDSVPFGIGVRYEDLYTANGGVADAGAVNVLYGATFGLDATTIPDQFWTQNVILPPWP